MRLGISLGYWGKGTTKSNVELAIEGDKLGFGVAWAAESWGNDVVSTLAYVAAKTEKIGIGSSIMQMPGRTPTMTAMSAVGLDDLSNGRFHLGLGPSGPQVSEGWHGVRFPRPLERTREYVEIVRMAMNREVVEYHGKHFELPLPDGPGKALHMNVHPLRAQIPIYIGAVGPKNLELAGEIADGWLAAFTPYDGMDEQLAAVAKGRQKAGKELEGFDVVTGATVAIGDDLEALADRMRPGIALYAGGMGSREQNFYNNNMRRLGYEEAAQKVQDFYLDKKYDEAMAAIPFELIDRLNLIGPIERISERLQEIKNSPVTTLNIGASGRGDINEQLSQLRQFAEAAGKAGLL